MNQDREIIDVMQRQKKIRRDFQESLSDQDGGLFSTRGVNPICLPPRNLKINHKTPLTDYDNLSYKIPISTATKGNRPMPNNLTKSISYAYPSSTNAGVLGMSETGAWYISLTISDIEGSGQCRTFMPHDAEGFLNPDDPDLAALFHETDGEICPYFKQYGHHRALAAVAA